MNVDFSNNAVTSIADARHIVMTLLWRAFNDIITFSDVNSTMPYVTSVTTFIITSAYKTRENSRFLSYPGRIKISILRLNPGFPYLVCKKLD